MGNYRKTNNPYADFLVLTWGYKSAYRLQEWTYAGYSEAEFNAAKSALIAAKLLNKNGALSKLTKTTFLNTSHSFSGRTEEALRLVKGM